MVLLLSATARTSYGFADFIMNFGQKDNWHDLQYLSAGATAGAIILGIMLSTASHLEPNSNAMIAVGSAIVAIVLSEVRFLLSTNRGG
jgi:hypothetical protein